MGRAIMWFRRDLRLADNPALVEACSNNEVLPVFVLDPIFMNRNDNPRKKFLLNALSSLNEALGGALVIRSGDPATVLAELAIEIEAKSVYVTKDFSPYGRTRDIQVAEQLKASGVMLRGVGSPYAVEPGKIVKDDGNSLSVFTPFFKRWLAHGWDEPSKIPQPNWVSGVSSESLPSIVVPHDIPIASERAAWDRWDFFSTTALSNYGDNRNTPGVDGTSRLSPYLRFGIVHPRQLLAESQPTEINRTFVSEIAWREFYADVLFAKPHTIWENLQPKMNALPCDTNALALKRFEAWCTGMTGYPIVDAGMRQMLATGWMHNRVRMIVASFLVKDLHLPWQWGAKFFMRHLVDGDIASNNHGWQWTAGTGTDAAPYFRVFNPSMQSEKFDPEGIYIKTWIPELVDRPKSDLHAPWASKHGAPANYPAPIVDHAVERDEALRRYKLVSGK